MQLISIKAENYRTLEDIKIDFSSKYCTISGKNNAGKSGVIRLLTALFQKTNKFPWVTDEYDFDYESDKTQWRKEKPAIKIE
jgi:predicted ATP-dependent endonuclease of OLD family